MVVTIPGTHASGIAMAATVGIYGASPDRGLEALRGLTPDQVARTQALVNQGRVSITARAVPDFIRVDLTVSGENNCCRIVVHDGYTCITELYVNDQPVTVCRAEAKATAAPLPQFSVRDAFDFITGVPLSDIEFMLDAARLNGALSEAGMNGRYGLNIAGTLSAAVSQGLMSDDLLYRIQMETVAASDARMGGAGNGHVYFGSGNQGITDTLPVVVLARELKAGHEALPRVLTLSHLVAISVHARYTRLSALCAASTAAMGAAAGMAVHPGSDRR